MTITPMMHQCPLAEGMLKREQVPTGEISRRFFAQPISRANIVLRTRGASKDMFGFFSTPAVCIRKRIACDEGTTAAIESYAAQQFSDATERDYMIGLVLCVWANNAAAAGMLALNERDRLYINYLIEKYSGTMNETQLELVYSAIQQLMEEQTIPAYQINTEPSPFS